MPNSHCQPCVGCTKNCYDFNPRVAYLADLNDDDRYWAGYRKLFAGAFPGIVLAYFTVPSDASVGGTYLRFALFILGGVGSFALVESFVKVSARRLTTLYGAVAFSLFYWYGVAALIRAVSGGPAPGWLVWPLRASVLALTAAWVIRTYRKETNFLAAVAEPPLVRLGGAHALADRKAAEEGAPEVMFEPDRKRVVASAGSTLLEIAESNGAAIEAGCRMGVCGADPVAVLEGMENLSAMSDDERSTLARLGLAENTRMACCARVHGPVTISPEPERPKRPASSTIAGFSYNRQIERVVVIGNGIAGVTAADHVRRRHPICEIDLLAEETHQLYNRMGISRLIYGRSAMQGLHLLPDSWCGDHAITPWLNTRAAGIDRVAGEVTLGTGEGLHYDRLILAMGGSSTVPAIDGFGASGSYVLRSADDALAIRGFSQRYGCGRAVVAGGGLLGLEAGYALQKLGLRVSVLELSDQLLHRQLDACGADLLCEYLEGLGVQIVMGAEASHVASNGRVRGVSLTDGRELPADVFLVCAGITPNAELAREARIEVNRGVLVDDTMQTSDPAVYAAGDVAEHRGRVSGLWPAAVEQAEVAADRAVGGEKTYQATEPVTVLKVVGIQLISVGRFEPESDADEVIALEDPSEKRYRKLVISDGRIVGAILLGYSKEASPVTTAVKRKLEVTSRLDALRAGDWGELSEPKTARLRPSRSLARDRAEHAAAPSELAFTRRRVEGRSTARSL